MLSSLFECTGKLTPTQSLDDDETFGNDSSSAATTVMDNTSVTSSCSSSIQEMTMFPNGLSSIVESIQSDMPLYVDSLGAIERDTGVPFTSLHYLVVQAAGIHSSCTSPSPWQTEEDEIGISHEIEVQFDGSKNLIKPSDEENVYEVTTERERRFQPINFFRSRSASRVFRFDDRII